MNEDLKIIITGSLDPVKTTTEIQNQLKKLEGQLNVTLGVDAKMLSDLTNKVKKLQNQIDDNSKQLKIIDDKKAIANLDQVQNKTKQLFTSVDKAVKEYSKLGTVKVDTNLNPVTKEVDAFTLSVKRADETVERLKFKLAGIDTGAGIKRGFELSDVKGTDNRQNVAEQVLQKEHQISDAITKQNKKVEHQLSLFKQQAEINVKKLKRQYDDKDLDHTSLNNYLNSVNKLNTSTPDLKNKMDNLNMSFKNIKESVDASTSHTLSFNDQMKIAAQRTVIWGTAMTSIYGSIEVLRQAVDVLYLIDEKLISIAKVSDGADLSKVFDQATESAYTFGRTIDGALTSISEIAKLGFNDKDAAKLSENALLLATIGDISDSDSANYLVAIMRQYGLAIEDTSKVLDSLNELSNKTGASTEDLAHALSKSSSSAQTAGISFDELVAMSASIVETMKISGNEAGNFLKSLSTRILRDTTLSDLEDIGITVRDNNGEIISATKILQNLGGAWDSLSKQQQNNISMSLGGVYHINKVSNLLQQQSQILKYTEMSTNSYGSAIKELETFQEGLEYKTNILKASLQELVMTFATDGGGRSGLVGLIEGATKIIQAFNERVEQTDGWNVKLPILAAGIYAVAKAFSVMAVAAKGARLSLGWIAAAVVGAEVLATAFMGATKSNSEAANSFIESSKGYSDSAMRLEELVKRHNELKPQIDKNSEANAEYKKVLAEITDIAPALIDSTDKFGSSLTTNKDKVDDYVESLKTMSDEQLKNAEATLQVSLTNAQNELDKITKERNKLSKEAKEMTDFILEYNKKYNVNSLSEAQVDYNKRTKGKSLINGELKDVADEYMKYHQILSMNSKELEKYEDVLKKATEAESNVSEIKMRQEEIRFLSSDYKDLSKSIRESFGGKIDTSVISSLDKDQMSGLNKLGKEFKDNKVTIDELSPSLSKLGIDQEVVNKITEQLSTTVKEGTQDFTEYADSVDTASNAEKEKITTSEAILGITQKQIDTLKESVSTYQLLSEQENLNANQKALLLTAITNLDKAYPALVKGKEVNIKAIQEEIRANDILLQATEKAANGQLTSQEVQTLNSAIGTKARIDLMNKELQALQKLAEIQESHMASLAASAKAFGDDTFSVEMDKLYRSQQRTQQKIQTINVDLSGLIPKFKNYTSSLSSSIGYEDKSSKSKDKNAKSTKNLAKEYENSIYVTDKFKNALEKLNLELQKQESIQSKYPEHSKAYQNSLKKEVELLESKKRLIQSQEKDLANQIRSGKIKETGIVSAGSYSANTGKYTGKYSKEINAASSKYGVDPFLIASIIQQESNFNPNARSSAGARGLMQLMPGTAKGLGVKNSYNPTQNIMGGTKYIAQMLAKFGGDIKKALMAYNAGAGNVSKILKSGANSWKEPKNYVNKVLGNYSRYNSISPSSTQNVASYYLNNFKQSSGFGVKRSTGTHGGLDLSNGKEGSAVKSLKSGKVLNAYYSKTGGYMVTVQQDDGLVAKYMHMQKGSLAVKKGQRVNEGELLGKVGNTGRSRGAHLHLQIEQNGKKIDPVPYLKKLGADTSKTVAEGLRAIDQAKSDLNSLRGDLIDINEQIEEARNNLIMSYVAEFDYKISQQEMKAENLRLATYHLDKSSEAYRKELTSERVALIEKQKLIEAERTAIKEMLKNKNLSAKTRAELQAKLNELNKDRYSNAAERDAITQEIINSKMLEYERILESINYKLEKLRSLRNGMSEDSKEYADSLKEEAKLMEDQKKTILQQVNELEKAKFFHPMTPEQLAEHQKKIDDLMLQYYGLDASLEDLRKSQADSVIDTLKRAIEMERDLKTKAIDEEIKKLQDAHDKKMKMYDDDLEKYEKSINEKLRLIDDQYSEDTFNKELKKMTDQELDLTNRINRLANDNSKEAKAQRDALEKELKELRDQIADKKYDRETELRKENLTDQLEDYREDIENKKESEQEKLDSVIDAKEKEKKELEYYYQELLNDDKKWAQMHKDILNGNLAETEVMLQQYLGNFKTYNEDMIKDLGMSWKELENLIDSITNKEMSLPGIGTPPSSGNSGTDNIGENPEEKIKAWQDYLSNKRKYEKSNDTNERKKLAAANDALRKKFGFIDGSASDLEYLDISKITTPSPELQEKLKDWVKYLSNKEKYEKSNTTKERQQLKSENDKLRNEWGFPDGSYEQLKNYKIYHTGGIVGGNEKGSSFANLINKFQNIKANEEFAKLEHGEVVLAENKLPNLVNNIIMSALPKLKLPNLSSPVSGSGSVALNINIENFNGTKQNINDFGNTIVNKLSGLGIKL